MSDPVISVEGLSKLYRLGRARERHESLVAALAAAVTSPIRNARDLKRLNTYRAEEEAEDLLWALDDVTFEVERGEVLGVVGRNGAGKSTLLKILSRITEPTRGRVRIRGKVSSLLEVGTGFHQDLTGRENIYLNGTILGMTKREIDRKFDEIVEFSGVSRFLDTPVKRYSSGMMVRLGFAVAAHLEPDVLIVDEVLAVGDAEFQKKCLGKMREITGSGHRTILFVSHNMNAVRSLCQSGVLLAGGRKVIDGDVESVVRGYLSLNSTPQAAWKRPDPPPDRPGIYFQEISICDGEGQASDLIDGRHGFSLRIVARVTDDVEDAQIAVRFTNADGVAVLTTANTDASGQFLSLRRGTHTYTVDVPGGLLRPSSYSLIVAAFRPGRQLFDSVENQLVFELADTGVGASVLRDGREGVVVPVFDWREEIR